MDRFLILCLSLTRANLTLSLGSVFTRNLMNLGTNGRRKKFDCARPNEALEVAEKAPRTSLLMKNSPQYWPGKETSTQSRKGLAFFVNKIGLDDSLHLPVFLLPNKNALTPLKGQTIPPKFICAFGLHAEYERELLKGSSCKNQNEK